MRIIGCDLHARQQVLAMLDTVTGEVVHMTLKHEGDNVREFYSKLPRPVLVGIEATGSMQWFLNLMEELGIECRVGHPAQMRACEPRKQKHDRRDAAIALANGLRRGTALWTTTDKAGSQHCRWRPTPLIGGVSYRRCTRSSKRRSRN